MAAVILLLFQEDFVREGDAALAARDYALAQAMYETALGEAPEDSGALTGLGIVRCRLGDYAWGLELLLEARDRGAGNPLEIGRAYYMLERPLDGIDPLREHAGAHPDDAEGWQLLGLCLEHEPDDEGAAGAFERSLELGAPNPDLVLYHLARVYRRLGRDASGTTTRLQEEHPRSPYTRIVQEERQPDLDPWARIRRGGGERPWYASATLQAQFDTNPLALGEDAVVPPNLLDRETWGLLAALGGGVRFDPTDELRLGADVRHVNLSRDGLSKFDLETYQASVSADWRIDDEWGAGLRLTGRRVDQGGREVLDEWSAAPWATLREAYWTRTRVEFSWTNQEFFFDALPGVLDPDQQVWSVTAQQEMFVPGTSLALVVGYAGSRRVGDGSEYDSWAHGGFLRAAHPVVWEIRAIAGVSYTRARYESASVRDASPSKRRDEIVTVTARLERPVTEWMTLHAQWTLTDNESNLGTYDYDQNVWAVGADFLF